MMHSVLQLDQCHRSDQLASWKYELERATSVKAVSADSND